MLTGSEGEEGAEPLLAARIMIEDCMCLLLDVDDIDRMFIMADGFREDEMQLRQRRSLLMEGFAASLRLPDTSMLNITPHPPSPQDPRLESSDGVFLRLMALHKGRVMLARDLRLLYPSPQAEARSMGVGPVRSPPLRLAWALLRNLRVLFTPGGLRAAPGAGQSSNHYPHPSLLPLLCVLTWLFPQRCCQGLQLHVLVKKMLHVGSLSCGVPAVSLLLAVLLQSCFLT